MRKRNQLTRIVAAATATLIIAPPSMAMPKSNANSANMTKTQADAAAKDPRLSGAPILGDDLNGNTIWVGPANKKAQASGFQTSATFACDVLKNQWALTYLMPDRQDQFESTADNGAYSAYFDLNYGLYHKNTNILNTINQKAADIEQQKLAHSDIVKRYETAKQKKADAIASLQTVTTKQASLDKAVERAREDLDDATTPESRAAAREVLTQAKSDRDAKAPDLRTQESQRERALDDAASAFAEAEGDYNSAFPNMSETVADITALASLFSSMRATAADAFNTSKDLLDSIENTPVGFASAGYNIWGDEQIALTQLMANNQRSGWWPWLSGNPTVARLEIFDIHSTTQSGAVTYPSVPQIPGQNPVSVGTSTVTGGDVVGGRSVMQNTSFRPDASSQLPVIQVRTTAPNDGAGVVATVVSRGAFCQARNYDVTNYHIVESSGDYQIKRPNYTPRTENVLYQNVGLNYKYIVRTDPTQVQCEMDVDKLVSHVSSSGSSGFLMWRHSWHNDEFSKAADAGLRCTVKPSNGVNAMSADQLDKLRQTMIMELVGEFAIQLGNGFAISTTPASEPSTTAFAEAGNAMQSMCGLNAYCQIGAIALKHADELFGQRDGASNSSARVSGHFYRDYELDDYTTLSGGATVEVQVPI